jgi:hypothetical protein
VELGLLLQPMHSLGISNQLTDPYEFPKRGERGKRSHCSAGRVATPPGDVVLDGLFVREASINEDGNVSRTTRSVRPSSRCRMRVVYLKLTPIQHELISQPVSQFIRSVLQDVEFISMEEEIK